MFIPYVNNRWNSDNRESDIFSELLKDRTIMISGLIDDNTTATVVASLLFLESQDDEEPISMFINSPGGNITSGLAIIAAMKNISCPVYTFAFGQTASMAAVILAAGDERYILPYTRVMIHQPSGGIQGRHSDMLTATKEISAMRNEIVELLAEHTGREKERIFADIEKDYYMSASEAVDYGLADEVLLCNPDKVKF